MGNTLRGYRVLFVGITACVLVVLAGHARADDDADRELIQLVIELLADNDKDIRALAFEQVRTEAMHASATKQFAAQLPKLTAEAQVGLLGALATRGDQAARSAILKLLAESPPESVRVAAISAIGALGTSEDTSLLIDTMTTGSTSDAAAARESLVRLSGDDVTAKIVDEFASANTEIQVALIEILAERRAVDTIPDILSLATESDAAVRRAAMAALGQIAGPEHIGDMLPGVLAAEPGRERDSAEKCVMFVANRIDEASSRADPVLAAMEMMNADDRTALLSTLGRIGGPAAQRRIEAAIADPDPRLHDLGVRALCNWPNASIAPRLIELAKTDEHEGHRIRALRALIRVAPLPDERSDDERLALLKRAMELSPRPSEVNQALDRARAIRTLDSLEFIEPYIDQPPFSKQACLSIVELAHHRELREAHKTEFHAALDKVIATSEDPVIVDRARRYKNNQTWVRPKKPG